MPGALHQQRAEFLRFRVKELLSLVIAQESISFITTDHVVRIEGNLPASAGRIDHELGDGITGGMTAQSLYDFETSLNRGAEMGRSFDEITLVQVVGFHPAQEELVNQRPLDLHTVVHSPEKNRLISQRDSRIGQTFKALPDLSSQLARMVTVDRRVPE